MESTLFVSEVVISEYFTPRSSSQAARLACRIRMSLLASQRLSEKKASPSLHLSQLPSLQSTYCVYRSYRSARYFARRSWA